MDILKLQNSLIFLCNLAIPPCENLICGLGNLLNFDEIIKIDDDISPNEFIKRNEIFLSYIYKFLNQKDMNYDLIEIELKEKFNHTSVKTFLEDLKIFAIKNYFSNPKVLKTLNLLKSQNEEYNKLEKEKDKKILNSLN